MQRLKSAYGGRFFHTVTCLSQVFSVCCCSHTLYCRVLNLKDEKRSLGLHSRSVHSSLPSLSLLFCFFPLSSVLNRKAFQETLPLTKRRYYIFLSHPFMFQCGLKLQVCLFESSSLFLWMFHSLVFLLAFVFFLSSIKAIRSSQFSQVDTWVIVFSAFWTSPQQSELPLLLRDIKPM